MYVEINDSYSLDSLNCTGVAHGFQLAFKVMESIGGSTGAVELGLLSPYI